MERAGFETKSERSGARRRISAIVLGRDDDFRKVGGRTLLERAARAALLTGAVEVVVVVPRATSLRGLSRLPVRIVQAPEGREGRASSLQAGIRALCADVDAIVVALADQPRVTARHLRDLARRVLFDDSVPIAASRYEGVLGAPCAFHASMLPVLMALEGPEGARPFIRCHPELVQVLDFADAEKCLEEPLTNGFLAQWQGPTTVLQRPAAASGARAPPPDSILACAV